MERRPWNERLVNNCSEINRALVKRYETEVGHSLDDPKDFLNWVGLKATPTAIRRTRFANGQRDF